MLINPFDPWKSRLCTCPEKLTLNPYTGCSHKCVYCYVSSYIPNFFKCRPKNNLISKLEKEAGKLNGELISIASSSDPYPPIEKTLKLTRKCLQILSKKSCRIQLVTKSTLVTRDVDLFRKATDMVSMSITTDNDKISRRLEPFAPLPSKRLKALRTLVKNRVSISVRIDPIIPFLNDTPERLVKKLASIKVPHVTCSTYKVKHDNWKRFTQAFPSLARVLQPLYFEKGERIGQNFYLPQKMRLEIVRKIKELVEKEEMRFSSCREGLQQLNSATCDGSWMTHLPKKT